MPQDGQLEHLGRVISTNGDIYDGSFLKGKFHGFGTKIRQAFVLLFLMKGTYYHRDKNSWHHGLYENNICKNIIKAGEGFPYNISCNKIF